MDSTTDANTLPPDQGSGGDWWKQLIAYGITKKIDYEYSTPFALSNDKMYGTTADGTVYQAGTKPTVIPGVSNGLLLVGGAVGVILLFMLLKD